MVDFCNLHDGYFALPSEAVVMYYMYSITPWFINRWNDNIVIAFLCQLYNWWPCIIHNDHQITHWLITYSVSDKKKKHVMQ